MPIPASPTRIQCPSNIIVGFRFHSVLKYFPLRRVMYSTLIRSGLCILHRSVRFFIVPCLFVSIVCFETYEFCHRARTFWSVQLARYVDISEDSSIRKKIVVIEKFSISLSNVCHDDNDDDLLIDHFRVYEVSVTVGRKKIRTILESTATSKKILIRPVFPVSWNFLY